MQRARERKPGVVAAAYLILGMPGGKTAIWVSLVGLASAMTAHVRGAIGSA